MRYVSRNERPDTEVEPLADDVERLAGVLAFSTVIQDEPGRVASRRLAGYQLSRSAPQEQFSVPVY